jgi:hypothetical protein
MEVDPATVQTNRLAKNARLELIALTDRDRQAFATALLNPTAPSIQAVTDAQWYTQISSVEWVEAS